MNTFAEKVNRSFVYLIRKRGLGDVLWIEPVIRQLATRYKKVTVFTKHNDLFNNYPLKNVSFKNELTFFEKILWKIEAFLGISLFTINLERAYEKKPKMHMLNAYQLKAGLPLTREYPHIYLDNEQKNNKIIPPNLYIVLHLETFDIKNYRQVYGINWESVVQYLNNKGFTVVQVGKQPTPIPGVRHIRTNLRDMILLLNKSYLFIGIDSGPSHIAASLNIPSVIFFGAVNPLFRHFPEIFKGSFLQQYCEYAGCYHEEIQSPGHSCKLVGNSGIPKCSFHTNTELIISIETLIKKYR